MTRLALALVRWACDPAKVEVLEGDLLELAASRRPVLGDALSACVLHSRFTTPAARRRAARVGALAAVAALLVFGAGPEHGSTAPARYIVNASDPAGSFTLEIEHRRVVRATLNDVAVDPARLVQSGGTLVIRGGDRGRDFRLAVKPSGGITWTARTP